MSEQDVRAKAVFEAGDAEASKSVRDLGQLERAVDVATKSLIAKQRADGHWVFELEADATIPAEYILLQHYLDEIDDSVQSALARYLRSVQGEHGGWPLFHGGAFDLSASVKAYFALKAAGDKPEEPHMMRARAAILQRGGAAHCNVFTRIQLALFGELSWRAVPVMPVEIMHLPRWFPFHVSKISYWSRTVIVPLLVLMARRPRAKNPRGVTVQELFAPGTQVDPPRARGSIWAVLFNALDGVLRVAEPRLPERSRRHAIDKAVAFVVERLNGEDGLGAIYPAIANAVMMFECLGYAKDHPHLLIAKAALRKLLVLDPTRSYCQPCVSPIWDTGLACHALMEAGGEAAQQSARRGLDWLVPRQILDVAGDWAEWRPGVRPGGWAFQYANPHYPDVDDTAVVAMAMHRFDAVRYRGAIDRAVEWIVGMQSRGGGWGAFDADNTYHYLNFIPFADHGALLDPPTADVSARCASLLGQIEATGDEERCLSESVAYLLREQEEDGSWFGRWGTNYIYGTWSALCALNVAKLEKHAPAYRRAIEFLVSRQREDGGWGEDGASYYPDAPRGEGKESTASQTAWALLGLMAAGAVDHPAVARGIDFLVTAQNAHGLWDEDWYTAVGFPRVFYLRYHGYRAFFPLWALARYRNLLSGNDTAVAWGM
ncbi:MAG TPA: squalene--hopene cyclase [Candidatus Cybelea sp.]|nr:squalene--hopene cyclase [Candidatus Cybelea sp.]